MDTLGTQSTIETESEETLGGLVIATAFKTVKWILITVALATTLFCCLFPYQTMIVYRSLGHYSKALVYCDVCLKQTDDKKGSEHAALLVNAINMSSKLLSDQTKVDYKDVNKDKLRTAAEKVVDYTTEYIRLPDGVRKAQSKAVDDYNISNTDRALHTQVYNFEAFARTENVLGLSYCGNYLDIGAIIADFGMIEFLYEDEDAIEPDDMIIMAAEVNAYLDFERYRTAMSLSDPDGAKNKVGGAYRAMSERDFEFFAESIGYAFAKAEAFSGLDKLYAVETLAYLADNLYAATFGYNNNAPVKDGVPVMLPEETVQKCLDAKKVTLSGGSETTLVEYYNKLNYIYINM